VLLDQPLGGGAALEIGAGVDAAAEIVVGDLELVGAVGLGAADPLAARARTASAGREQQEKQDRAHAQTVARAMV